MSKNSAPNQVGLLTALGAHLELLGALLKKADAYSSTMPQSSVANLFRSASAYVANVANDPSLKKFASHEGQRTGMVNKNRAPRRGDASPSRGVNCVNSISSFSSAKSTSVRPIASGSDEDPLDELRRLALTGGAQEVLSILERDVDPNHVFSNFKVGRRSFVEGTALGIAAHRGQLETVSTLLRYGARPDATYSVVVGAEKTKESFPVGFSAVRDQNTEMLELLLDARADLHTMTSSLDATMLWEAAYFGKEQMAQYVLDHGIEIDAAATSQDNRSWKFTALHVACYKGEVAIVNMLLQRTADVEGRNENGRTPLADSILKGHGDIVRMLIAARGNLFSTTACGPMTTPSASIPRTGSNRFNLAAMLRQEEDIREPQTPVQLLFHEANDHVIAEAAKGLQLAPRPIDTLTFIRFLSAKGNAPVEIMKAIAQPQELWYWSQKNERAHVQTGMMAPDANFIVAYGPHKVKLKAMFDKKEMASPDVLAFIDHLAPSKMAQHDRVESRRVRGRLMMCDVPGIFFNPEVLLTMTECRLPEFFEMQSVQAIVNVHWREVASTANFQIVFQVLYCTVSMCLNILFLELEREPWRPMAFSVVAWVNFAFWTVEVMLEVFEMVGFYHAKLFVKVYCHWSNVFDWARLLMSGWILLYSIIQRDVAKQAVWFNCCFGFMMMVRWMRVLYVFRAVKFFGIYLLPITACLSHVVPFCAVLTPFIMGFANMYYAFGRQGIVDSFLIVLRIILLGDQNLQELEGLKSDYENSGDGDKLYVAGTVPPTDEYSYVVRVFLVVCAMVMGTAMMNIFIAVLSEEYSEAYRIRHGMFFRSRAQLAIHEYITWRGMRRAVDVLRLPVPSSSASIEGVDFDGHYVWYFTREEDLVDEALAASLQSHKAEIIHEMQKQHSELVGEMRRYGG